MVRADDRERLRAGFHKLSPHSRYLRFFTDKPRLTEGELTYLTDVDQERHVAIGAVELDDHGHETDGVGVARLIRYADRPDTAEAAVAVLDDLHGQGLGWLLLERLITAGVERGVRRVRTEFLEGNQPMRSLIEQLGEPVEVAHESGVAAMEFELPNALGESVPGEGAERVRRLAKLLALAAQGLVVVVLGPVLTGLERLVASGSAAKTQRRELAELPAPESPYEDDE